MFFIFVIVAGLLQITVLKELNFLIVLAIFSGLRKGPVAGLLIGGVIGIFVEIVSSRVFGLNFALYSIMGFLSGLARTHVYYKENFLTEAVFLFCGASLFYFLYFILTHSISPYMFSRAFFSACVSPVLFKLAWGSRKI